MIGRLTGRQKIINTRAQILDIAETGSRKDTIMLSAAAGDLGHFVHVAQVLRGAG
ncbi:MAG: hypothetical protein AAF067_08090 [Pseudomonadota bacterium]